MTVNKIIDNKRKTLLDNFLSASKDFDELSIATGYWDLEGTKLLIDNLSNYKKIRLIIGQEPLIDRYNLNAVEPDFPDKDIFEDLQRLKPESGLYETVKELKRKADTGELEVKVYKRNFLHAKCYIFGNYKTEKAIGIIGSSNFTKNGLTSNLELNTGESDNRIIQFAPQTEVQENGHLSWFDEIWSDEMSVNWTGEFTELINTSNHGDEIFSPYEMYIKTLEYIYSDEVEDSKDIKQLQGKTLQAFQERNIKQLIKRLEKYKVAMLADSVGLGKTISAIGVIKQYKGRVIIISPASLVNQWEIELAQEDLSGIRYKVVSMQDMNGLENEMKIDRFADVNLFVIDEAHNLRNHSSSRFQKVYDWINQNADAHTLLLTATPVNNSLSDLTNQILLGTRGEQDTLPVYAKNSTGVLELKSFYETIDNLKKKINQNKAKGNDLAEVLKEARATIEPIIRAFVVRNTRQGIQNEFGGVDINGELKTFPKVGIKNVSFNIDAITIDDTSLTENLSKISAHQIEEIADFTQTLLHPKRQMKDLAVKESKESIIELLYKVILSLSFTPYRYDMYDFRVYGKDLQSVMGLKLQPEFKKNLARQISLYGILRTVFLKRLESSSSALTSSLKKYEKRLNIFEQILNDQNKVITLSDIDDIEDEYLEDDGEQIDWTDEKLLKAIEDKSKPVSEESHDLLRMKEDLAYEKEILRDAIFIAEKLKDNDVKLEEFKSILENIKQNNPTKKVLVFSFFADTVKYLEEKLLVDGNWINKNNSGFVSGKNKKEALEFAERFAPIAKQVSVEKDKEITYLFTTDVLAEGQNLQDCGLIINYDLHWNPVRMIQRNGRINRLGSSHAEVSVINMKPHDHLDRYLRLFKSLQDKIEIINQTIGSDASVLGEVENPLDYTGVYDNDSEKATEEYIKLENNAESFTDDQFVQDLKHFLQNATEEERKRLEHIPHGKWGQIDFSNKTLSLVEAKFDNNQSAFSFVYSNDSGAMDIMMRGEALKYIKSEDKKRLRAQNSLDRETFEKQLKSVAKQLIKFSSSKDSSLKPSEQKVSDLALSFYNWNQIEIDRLNEFFRTRNVIESKKVRSLVRKIGDAIRNNETHDQYFEELRKSLPKEAPVPPRCTEVISYINFLNKNLWKN